MNINLLISTRFEETPLPRRGRIKKLVSSRFAQPSPQRSGGLFKSYLWSSGAILFILFLGMALPCRAEYPVENSQEVFLSDVKKAPRVWKEGLKGMIQPSGLLILGGTTVATLVTWNFKEEIAREIQRHDNYRSFSSIGDDYGSAVNLGIPQVGVYLLGLGLKNEKIRELGLLTTHTAIVSGLLILGLKGIVGADRPGETSTPRFQSSFPSAHALGTAALAGSIHGKYGWKYGLGFEMASLFTGLTRIVDNRHRPHEVVAGWGIGFATGYAMAMGWEKLRSDNRSISLAPWVDSEENSSIGLTLQIRF